MNSSDQFTATTADQLLRIQDVVTLTTLSKSCINLWVAQQRFPKPAAISATVKVWRTSDVTAWINNQFEINQGI
jgi:predicted DNA-binding transcriptional regulator AlpA